MIKLNIYEYKPLGPSLARILKNASNVFYKKGSIIVFIYTIK